MIRMLICILTVPLLRRGLAMMRRLAPHGRSGYVECRDSNARPAGTGDRHAGAVGAVPATLAGRWRATGHRSRMDLQQSWHLGNALRTGPGIRGAHL